MEFVEGLNPKCMEIGSVKFSEERALYTDLGIVFSYSILVHICMANGSIYLGILNISITIITFMHALEMSGFCKMQCNLHSSGDARC